MSNKQDERFFRTLCKQSSIKPKEVIDFVWGKAIGDSYWAGNESKTVRGSNIWNARSEAIFRGLYPSKKRK